MIDGWTIDKSEIAIEINKFKYRKDRDSQIS